MYLVFFQYLPKIGVSNGEREGVGRKKREGGARERGRVAQGREGGCGKGEREGVARERGRVWEGRESHEVMHWIRGGCHAVVSNQLCVTSTL